MGRDSPGIAALSASPHLPQSILEGTGLNTPDEDKWFAER
jgi:hypothetical protein